MGYKKGKKELGIYYAKTLVSIAEEISAKNAGKEKAGIQKIFSALQRRGGTVRKNMAYLVTHWIYRLSLFTPWDDEELWAVDMASILLSYDASNMQKKAYFQNTENQRRTRKAAGNHFRSIDRF